MRKIVFFFFLLVIGGVMFSCFWDIIFIKYSKNGFFILDDCYIVVYVVVCEEVGEVLFLLFCKLCGCMYEFICFLIEEFFCRVEEEVGNLKVDIIIGGIVDVY